MPDEYVIDTNVLQKANALLTREPRVRSQFRNRIALLQQIDDGLITLLISRRLLAEYQAQVREPRNDFVRAFFAVLTIPGRAIWNWAQWPGSQREKARQCEYPIEDDHVLRTAIRPENGKSTIVTEEEDMLRTDACIYRRFRVHIRNP